MWTPCIFRTIFGHEMTIIARNDAGFQTGSQPATQPATANNYITYVAGKPTSQLAPSGSCLPCDSQQGFQARNAHGVPDSPTSLVIRLPPPFPQISLHMNKSSLNELRTPLYQDTYCWSQKVSAFGVSTQFYITIWSFLIICRWSRRNLKISSVILMQVLSATQLPITQLADWQPKAIQTLSSSRRSRMP